MAIPKLLSYDMPSIHAFPGNKITWDFDPARAVLLIHDMQGYFLSFYPEGSPLIKKLVTAITELRNYCKAHDIPVVYTAQPINQAPEDRGLLTDFWGRGIDNKPELKDIVAELKPSPNDVVLTKWRYSAFHNSDLEERMKEGRRDQLLICGVYAHIGCMMTAANAFMLNIKPFLVGDAIADFSEDEHLMALRYTAGRCGRVVTVNEVLGA